MWRYFLFLFAILQSSDLENYCDVISKLNKFDFPNNIWTSKFSLISDYKNFSILHAGKLLYLTIVSHSAARLVSKGALVKKDVYNLFKQLKGKNSQGKIKKNLKKPESVFAGLKLQYYYIMKVQLQSKSINKVCVKQQGINAIRFDVLKLFLFCCSL